MKCWLRGSWVVLLVALVVSGAGCQWDVPLDPFIDSGLDASDPDAGTDGPTDAPSDGMPMATLTVIRNGTASGTVTSNAVGAAMIDCGATCTAQFPPGTLITLTETPGTGATFAGWSGVCTDTSPNCSFTLDSDTTVQATFDISRHTITIAPGGNGAGSVTSNVGGINCPGTCEATVDYGTPLMLTATPVAPSIFAGWNDVGCTGTTPCTFTVTQDETIDAAFALNYTVTVSKNGNGNGTVTSAPAGINCGSDCNEVYSAGTMVTLTAAAAADSDFVGWGGACTGTGSCTVTVNALVSVTANFALKRYTLSSTRSGTGAGVVTSNPAGINCGTDCDELYDHGTQVTLTAMADVSSTFTAWSEAGCPGTGACVVTLTGARSVGATFTLNRYQLTVAKSGNGASLGTVTSTPVGINCGADCDELYDANTMVTLSASTMSGASFMGWSGACTGTGNCVVTMSGAQNVTAMFALNQFTLSVNKAGNGAGRGTVTSSPAGISCGATCSAGYQFGQSVTLTPTAMSGATFTGWSGGGCSGVGNCVVTIGGDTAVTATFELDTYTLSVVRAGNAASTGSVTSAPAGITCNTATNDCDQGYTFGTAVTLTATAGAGSTFAGWSGGGCAGTGTCMVTVDAAKIVTATFTLDEALTVTKAGAGAPYGTVASAPAGINCGNDCSENFGVGTMVTLTATVQAGAATFAGWSGACAGTQASCVVTVAAATNAVATFDLVPHVLTAARAGDGSGSIESNVAGINCGTDCSEPYGYGTTVVLTATPDAGATFTGWSGGGCSGTGACSVTVTTATTVTATFQADRVLTVSTAGNGAGSVASVPGGISCPGDCMETFTHGQMVTLTATPSTGSTFASWSGGGCTGTAPCTVTMTAARSVQATFTLTTHTLTVTKAGTGQALGTVTSMPAGINCGADCNETVNYGTQLTLTASAAAGATFVGWSGGGCNGTGMCVVTVTANTMVTANFEADKTLTVSRAGTGSTYGLVTATGINCGNDCTEPYPHDSFVQLTASVPVAAAATFSGWSGGGCSGAQATCTVRMDMAQMVTATFNIRQHTVSVATNGGNGAGTVASTPMGIMAPTTPSASFNYGTTVTLAASPSTGSNFTGWSGVSGCSGTGSCDVLVDGAKAVTATFTLQQFALSVSKTGTSTALATVTSTPAGINCGATCSSMFNYNTPVQLSVSFMPGVRFMGWSGEGCTGTGTCSVTMTQARNVSAAFEGDKVLSVTVNGNGSGSVISAPAGIMTPAMTSAAYTHGTSVTLTAAANTTTSNFAGWSGSCASAGTNAQCVVTMDQARDVTATFTLKTYTLTLNKSGAGVGTVTSDVAGINCGTACPTQNATYNHGQTVVLSHVAGADSQFVAWGGACTGANCSVSMVADQTVTANFKRTDKTLTVSVAGNGSGTVTSNPAGIDAPTDGTETYAHDTMVTLTANTDTVTSNFAGWSGACTGTMLTCSVTMDQARSVTATFTLKTYTLTLNKSGAGAGTVTSNPAGINCGTTCSTQNATYNHGQSVTLSQLASTGSEFVAWGGACGGAMCTVVMTQDRTVTANFKLTDKTLTVSVAGNGAGTVTSNPAGINAPTDGTETYLHGTMVTLTANPDTVTSNFAGWSGGCTGTMLTCSVTMDQARSVTATFTLKTYTLTLNKTGAGVGTVSSNPAGINCGTACATQNATYNHGQSVTLSHLAGADSEFVAWGGACGGATCTVAMTQDRTVTANFKRTDKTLTVNVTGSGTVTSMDGGINAPSDPTHTYAHGTTVMLMAAWNATSHDFVWGGACAGSLATCSVTMDQAQTVTATFTLKNWTLTVAKAGVVAAAGTVTSTMPAGAINCGADCSETVTHGTMVTLTATPGTGDIFFGWSGGGCSGTGSCTTTVTAATMVTATFDNCVRSTQSCSNGLFSQCGTNGDWVTHSIPNGSATGGQLTIPMQNYACPMLACHASQPRCIDISASNGLNAALDAPEVSPTGLDVSLDASSPAGGANIIIDTNNFSAGTGTTRITLADGSSLDVPAIVVEQPATMMTPQGPDILVLKTRTFTVRPSTFVEVRGTRALGIVANFDIFIGGTIDASANEYTSGAGASLVSTCAGTQNATASGGGGNWDPGGASTSGAAGGAILSAGFVVPLQGGCRGGMIVVSAGNTWVGGSPGGAIQFVSRRRTAISPTGLLNVNGGGGFAGVDSSVFQGRASGGGSGGGILIESPSVTIDPGGVFSGRGGSGSAASFGGNVAHGTEYNPVTGAGAASVSCTSCGTSGAGGTESAQPGNATGSSSARAGGGGSVGRTVFRNQNGVVSIPGGALRIRHQLLTLPTRSPP